MATQARTNIKGWWSVGSRRWVLTIVVLALILLVSSAWSWWHYVYSSPHRVFDRMLRSSLTSATVSKHVTQADSTQALNQAIQLETSPKQEARAVNTLQQDQGNATVITESIGNPTTDFVRYLDIKTTQKNLAGKDYNFSPVLGVWGKSNQADATSGGVQLFNQTVLGIVPVANLPLAARQKLLAQINADQVYNANYASVQHQTINGRPVYAYQVTVKPVAYINMLKTFAHNIGINRLDQVDASQYQDSPPISFIFNVDVWSGELIKVTYTDSQRIEDYSAYGAHIPINEPASSLTVEDLQNRLQQIQ